MNISELGEFNLIKKIKDLFPSVKSPVKLGIGDDCAIIQLRDREILISSDLLVEGTHFKVPPFKWKDVGKKAILANISDIAAMGGIPEAFTVSIGIPPDKKVSEIEALYLGLKEAASKYRCQLIGGDTSKSDSVFISITIIGSNEKNFSILRSTAKPENLLCVTGTPGTSAIGLEAILNGYPPILFMSYINKHIEPHINIPFARGLSILKAATSMIDISDGLISDCERIAEESKIKIVIEKDKLPKIGIQQPAKSFLKEEEEFYILHGGEEFELIFTVDKEKLTKIEKIAKETQTKLTVIGYTEEGEGVYIKDEKGTKKITAKGFKHF